MNADEYPMMNNPKFTELDLQRFHEISEDIWQAIDYLDHRSAFYYLSNNIPEEKIEELCAEINAHEIIVATHLKSVKWDSQKFQQYRSVRWGRRREEYKETKPSLSSLCDAVAHYLYRLSEGDLPKDRPSLDERFEASLNKKNRNPIE